MDERSRWRQFPEVGARVVVVMVPAEWSWIWCCYWDGDGSGVCLVFSGKSQRSLGRIETRVSVRFRVERKTNEKIRESRIRIRIRMRRTLDVAEAQMSSKPLATLWLLLRLLLLCNKCDMPCSVARGSKMMRVPGRGAVCGFSAAGKLSCKQRANG